MRIYRSAEFLLLPPYTFYRKGRKNGYGDGNPWVFCGLSVKMETSSEDPQPKKWAYVRPYGIEEGGVSDWMNRYNDMLENGASYPMGIAARWDIAVEDDIFLVLEQDDLQNLLKLIDNAIYHNHFCK